MAGLKKPNDHAEPTKRRMLKKNNIKNNDITSIHLYLLKQQQNKNVSAVGTVI